MERGWILVTGCSSGIGRALVPALRSRGWKVVATARKLEALEGLPAGADLRCLALDVTDPASLAAAVQACADLRLVGLVNNAGYGQMGPLEQVRPEELRAQLETNIVGLHMATNAFLPLIRRSAAKGEGRIVQVASVLGRMSIPLAGAYNASKHAVVALAETLRLEIGEEIAVISVEPGNVRSEFRSTMVQAWGDLPERAKGTRYEAVLARNLKLRERQQDGGMSAERAAALIARAISKRRPPRRLSIGADAFWGRVAKALLPAALWERMLRKAFGLR